MEEPVQQQQQQRERADIDSYAQVSDDDGEIPATTAATMSKAVSKQSTQYMLTFENGLHDDSDSEVEALTQSFSKANDGNNNNNNDNINIKSNIDANSSRTDKLGVDQGISHHSASPGNVHFVHVLKESDSELSDEGILDRNVPGEIQIPVDESDTDTDIASNSQSTRGFLHVADDGNSSIRPDTPTPSTPRSNQTQVSTDWNTEPAADSCFVRPKPLSGSTTAVFGSVESLGAGSGELLHRNRRFGSECNLSAPNPMEGFHGGAGFRRRAFHGSVNRLSLGSFPVASSSTPYVSDDDCGKGAVNNSRAAPSKRRLNRRWSLAHADSDALEEVRVLQNQLDKVEKELKKKEKSYQQELSDLRRENQRQQKLIGQNLAPEAKIEATMQHEITRMTSENLDLRETIDKQTDQIRKLKKMLKIYAKKLKDEEAEEIAAELEQEDRGEKGGVGVGATGKHRDRAYLGMLQYRKEDEGVLIRNLILELSPRTASGLIPGLPAYTLFMCVRHTDHINDDDKVRSLLTHTINGIRKVVKKHSDDLERVTLWLANTCRLMHTLKQYSGEKQFQGDNQTRQNEMCLRNFDLSEYRQVFADLAVYIHQTLVRLMQDLIQPYVVPAILEHEAIAGLTSSKPAGPRGRLSGNAHDLDDERDTVHSLDGLMRTLNTYMRILTQHAVDPELIKQIVRQLFYFMCAGAINNLLLRQDMCNWSKGMQIRYNLSHMEQWLRDNKLNESGAQSALDPIIQASQLLQARKTDTDVDSVCEMCSKLTVAQIVKILNLYTPVDDCEERVPISFIRKIQTRLKQRADAGTRDNALLMETKFTFPVTFPFNPSSILLDTIEVPEILHLGFLKKL